MDTSTQVDNHYGFGSIMDRIEAGLRAAGKDLNNLKVDDLAPIDEFHTRGRESTLEVAALDHLQASDHILDVGCGLGGTARFLANTYGCQVTGIDLTHEYIDVGVKLTQMVGLSGKVRLHEGSALQIPFEGNTFDIAWTEHVQMNIADKNTFYGEMARVLKPGGRLLFHDIFRGPGKPLYYPVPWAENESISFLATAETARAAIENAGLKIQQWLGKVDESIEFFKAVSEKIAAAGPPPIGIHLLMGDNAKDKLQNHVRNLTEKRVVVVMGLAIKS